MTRSRFASALVAGLAVSWLAPAGRAAAESPADLFRDALANERSLSRPGVSPTAAEWRDAIAAYESIARDFPASGDAARARWHAAGLALEAYQRHRDEHDLAAGFRLLRELAEMHPRSPLAERVAERREQLEALSRVTRLLTIERTVWSDVVRVVIRLDRETDYYAERLSGPERLFLDFPDTEALPTLRNESLTFDDGERVVHGIRLGSHPERVTRVVLDTTDAEACEVYTVPEPYRVVADCRRALPPPITLAADLDPALPAPGGGPLSLARQLGLQVSRIVIDPGHGGHDPGAHSHGLREADIVLDIAQRLERRLLAEPGVEVVLTRRDDTFIPLTERTALANRVEADLFLSIHANASVHGRARGVETYFLNFAQDPEAERIAARENLAGGGTMTDLAGLLETIAGNSKANESSDFAATIQSAMVHALRQVDPDIPDLGVKQAPFVVLIGAHMPSVLAEIAFVNNDRDARLLSDDDARERIAGALFAGILRYRHSLNAETQLAQQD